MPANHAVDLAGDLQIAGVVDVVRADQDWA